MRALIVFAILADADEEEIREVAKIDVDEMRSEFADDDDVNAALGGADVVLLAGEDLDDEAWAALGALGIDMAALGA